MFISHATADKWIAKVICEKLEAIGIETFRDDRDIDGGDDIPEKIRSELTRSRELLVLYTPQSVDRKWVTLEVGAAWVRRLRIVAIRHHLEVERLPDILKSKKAITLNEVDEYLEEVRGRLLKWRRRK